MKNTVFWDVTSCSPVEDHLRFRGTQCLSVTEAARSKQQTELGLVKDKNDLCQRASQLCKRKGTHWVSRKLLYLGGEMFKCDYFNLSSDSYLQQVVAL